MKEDPKPQGKDEKTQEEKGSRKAEAKAKEESKQPGKEKTTEVKGSKKPEGKEKKDRGEGKQEAGRKGEKG